uniref:Uncharacterized protein n=1 Tax=Mus musculus TaxID=10090 RepID=Q3V0H0_MOUSE|nr:unnamed protein product [Mus musculus]
MRLLPGDSAPPQTSCVFCEEVMNPLSGTEAVSLQSWIPLQKRFPCPSQPAGAWIIDCRMSSNDSKGQGHPSGLRHQHMPQTSAWFLVIVVATNRHQFSLQLQQDHGPPVWPLSAAQTTDICVAFSGTIGHRH